MLNRQIHIGRDYIDAVFRHGVEPMEPRGFAPNWKDQPSRYKIYQGVDRFPLPVETPTQLATMADILQRMITPIVALQAVDIKTLSTMLLFAHGLLNQRVDINWNRDERERSRYHLTTFGRGTASGGGRYPTEIFWVCGETSVLRSGVYHYDPAHHALARLATGDFTHRLQRVVQHSAASTSDQYLLISLNFWKNAFKYNSYAYHVVTEDLGALLGSLRALALGFKTDFPLLLWYNDEVLNRLIGLQTEQESVFAVLPLHSEISPARNMCAGDATEIPVLQTTFFQRSHTVVSFPAVEEVHRSTLISDEPLPDLKAISHNDNVASSISGEAVLLPALTPELLDADLLEVFQRRRSSFGRFSSVQSLDMSRFAALLAFASASRMYASDVKQPNNDHCFTRLMTFVNNVEGLERGAYAYDDKHHCLWEIARADFSLFLQEHYFLQNYSLAEIAALVVIVGNPGQMLEVYGNRGYRILNAEVGVVAQNMYLAATALGMNCGAALGFDNLALNQKLGLGETGERSLLFLLIGHGHGSNADYVTRFVYPTQDYETQKGGHAWS